jgi:predicted small lipoprotein YifL
MKLTNKLILSVSALALAAALTGCGRGGGANQPVANGAASGQAGGGSSTGPSASNPMPCPSAADVATVVGASVEQKPRGAATCYYETPDSETTASIMSFAPSRAEQLLGEMKESAKPYGAEVEAIPVGERGYAWGSRGYGEGFAVAGGRAYMLDVTVKGGTDTKAAVTKLLKMMLR